MCGIAGLIDRSGGGIDPRLLVAMADQQAHRGPDDQGIVIFSTRSGQVLDLSPDLWDRRAPDPAYEVGLSHRRLAIIDLSPAGRQPMSNEDGSVWVVANGEIYNYREIRTRLLSRGHRFKSQSDTEVLVHLYEDVGPALVEELNGMFAFALWDAKSGRLLLARDRYGVKPLYLHEAGRRLAFASEVKAFLALPWFHAELELRALADHLTFQNTFGDLTFFRGVRLLPPGHLITVDSEGTAIRRYWQVRFTGSSGEETSVVEGLRERFPQGVERQLMSEVPLGTYLSGGMDTGSISAVARRSIPTLHTFTCGFDLHGVAPDEQEFDEGKAARALAEHLGTTHHALTLGADALARLLPRVIFHLEEPRMNISYPNFAVAGLIRRHVTVVLSGVGGDEIFAGYPWRYETILGCTDPATFTRRYFRSWTRLLSEEEKTRFLTSTVRRSLGDYTSFETFRQVLDSLEEADPLHRALAFDFQTYLPGLLLVEDKLSMAHSVESRVPFTDNDFVDFALTVPSSLRLREGVGKHALRQAMAGLLPEWVLVARKQGFIPPDGSWYRGHTFEYLTNLLCSPRALDRGLFEPTALRSVLDEHRAGVRNHRNLLWSLCAIEWWHRLFIDGESPGGEP